MLTHTHTSFRFGNVTDCYHHNLTTFYGVCLSEFKFYLLPATATSPKCTFFSVCLLCSAHSGSPRAENNPHNTEQIVSLAQDCKVQLLINNIYTFKNRNETYQKRKVFCYSFSSPPVDVPLRLVWGGSTFTARIFKGCASCACPNHTQLNKSHLIKMKTFSLVPCCQFTLKQCKINSFKQKYELESLV